MAFANVEMEQLMCASCSIVWWLPADTVRRRREDGEGFYCPHGHENYFNDSEIKRLRRRVKELEQKLSIEMSRPRERPLSSKQREHADWLVVHVSRVGPARAESLIREFGRVESIGQATIDEMIEAVPGVAWGLATSILNDVRQALTTNPLGRRLIPAKASPGNALGGAEPGVDQ